MSNPKETTWTSQSGYVWSLIGSAVGFANILSFSSQVYRNGGGAFLIPYCLALFMLGIPMLILEGIIGHRWRSYCVRLWQRVGQGWQDARMAGGAGVSVDWRILYRVDWIFDCIYLFCSDGCHPSGL